MSNTYHEEQKNKQAAIQLVRQNLIAYKGPGKNLDWLVEPFLLEIPLNTPRNSMIYCVEVRNSPNRYVVIFDTISNEVTDCIVLFAKQESAISYYFEELLQNHPEGEVNYELVSKRVTFSESDKVLQCFFMESDGYHHISFAELHDS